ncbi:hypothetical protein ACHAQI_006144 [Fusarium lateritium]
MNLSDELAVRLLARQILRFHSILGYPGGEMTYSPEIPRFILDTAFTLEPRFGLIQSGDRMTLGYPWGWDRKPDDLRDDLHTFEVFGMQLLTGRIKSYPFAEEEQPEESEPVKTEPVEPTPEGPREPTWYERTQERIARKAKEDECYIIKSTPEDPLGLGVEAIPENPSTGEHHPSLGGDAKVKGEEYSYHGENSLI